MLNNKIYVLLLVALLFVTNHHILIGQEIEINTDGKIGTDYFQKSILLKYNVKFPKTYNSLQKQILVVGLHGFGGNSDAFINIWDNLDNINFIYACPQAPYALKLSEGIGYDWSMWMSKDIEQINLASELTVNYISELVISLKKRYNISAVYLMGFSQGAIFTYLTGIKNHHLFDGIICLSGPGISEPLMIPYIGESSPDWIEKKYIDAAKSLRVFIAHGSEDGAVKYNLAQKSNKILIDAGYDVTFNTFNGGHKIYSKTLKEVLEWINQK